MNTKPVILLVSSRREELEGFIQGLRSDDNINLNQVETPEEALKAASAQGPPALVVIDGSTVKESGLDLARELLKVNAFIYTAILSDMDEALFHEQSEGLGILAHLPSKPDSGHARQLLRQLGQIMNES
ncbi:MAG: response regulator [Proteobacteria bacterium]|nr:response regulator [Pseudomonadota bacterium]MBU4470459.1 response regulator [Pseudomonadota bacterium]MCG2753512.1 response regulator [Desulfobacteraceae bacterium]